MKQNSKVLDVAGISKKFGAVEVLSDVSFQVDKGETVTIANDAEHPSKLVLPVVAGIDVLKAAPPASQWHQGMRPRCSSCIV